MNIVIIEDITYPELVRRLRGSGLYLLSWIPLVTAEHEENKYLFNAIKAGLIPEGKYWQDQGDWRDKSDDGIEFFSIGPHHSAHPAAAIASAFAGQRLSAAVTTDRPVSIGSFTHWCDKPAAQTVS